MKVAVVLGTRPQIIKSAPVIGELAKRGIGCDVVNTGQHYDYEMNREFFSELGLPSPAADLEVGKGTPSGQVSQIIGGLGRLFAASPPDLAIVPGDTNSALAAGIACSKSGVKVAHLESGCRSNDFRMAEEVNRRLLDHSSQVLLCPTESCVQNLKREHVLADTVENVGDTMYDTMLKYSGQVDKVDVGSKYGFEPGAYAFMTLHRAEAVDDAKALEGLVAGAGSLGTRVVFSVHPRTRERIQAFGIKLGPEIKTVGPLPYVDTLALVRNSSFVITDSGGLQKEAFWMKRPCLIARESTEWMEIVEAGAAFLVGTDKEGLLRGAKRISRVDARNFRGSQSIFGRGHAAEKVARVVSRALPH